MKRLKLFLALIIYLLCYSTVLNAQIKVGDTVRLKRKIEIKKEVELNHLSLYNNSNADYSIAKFATKVLPSGYYYIVISKKTKTIILEPLSFKDYSIGKIKRRNKRKKFLDNNILDYSIHSKLYNDKTFEINAENFEVFADKASKAHFKKLPTRLSIGVVTLPFKYRPQEQKSFDTEFNINTTANIRIASVFNTHLYGQLGAGFGSINLNSTNSDLKKGDVQDKQTLSFLSGIMLQHNRVQIGLYMGWDRINNQRTINWVSNGNLWFGFGAGYNLFKNTVEKGN